MTAHYRTSNEENTGFVFLRCRLTGETRATEFISADRGARMRALFLSIAGWGHTSDRKVGTTGAIRREKKLRGLLSTSRKGRARIRKLVSRGPGS